MPSHQSYFRRLLNIFQNHIAVKSEIVLFVYLHFLVIFLYVIYFELLFNCRIFFLNLCSYMNSTGKPIFCSKYLTIHHLNTVLMLYVYIVPCFMNYLVDKVPVQCFIIKRYCNKSFQTCSGTILK